MQKPTEIITSRQNALVSLASALTERKYRRKEGLFRFDGRKLFLEALQANVPLAAVLLRESTADQILEFVGDKALPQGCRCVLLSDALFDRISEEKSPDGVICLSKSLDKLHKIVTIDKRISDFVGPDAGRILMLESVRDPGNLGTVIRTARAFGISHLILSSDCADIYHSRTARAAMGTLFTQSVLVAEDFVGAVRELAQTRAVYAAALDERAARLGSFPVAQPIALVVGNEGHGLSAEVIRSCTSSVYIPMEPGVESLNAALAAAVLLWELYRGN